VVAIAAGRRSSAAVSDQGSLWTWGWNGFGQLGTGTTTSALLPAIVHALGRVVGLAQGSESMHRLVLVAAEH
jgi:alpha-tubulin suppressor-like RCC1 family protein